MGCAAGHPETNSTTRTTHSLTLLDQGELLDVGSSFDVWSWNHLQKGQPGPPCRARHEKHLKSLATFLLYVDQTPSSLEEKVMRRRLSSKEEDMMGNVQLFNSKMTELSADLIKMGTYLLMMKLKFMVMRNLSKGIFREVRGRPGPDPIVTTLVLMLADKSDKLDFTPFEHVFGWQDGCDADETAACLATLIYNGAIKGYLSHDRRKVVFAKE
eukprot:Skav227913  [mRNA]  locus=scaffold146:117775:127327:+ [translate_table: standard]